MKDNILLKRLQRLVTDETSVREFHKLFVTLAEDRGQEIHEEVAKEYAENWVKAKKEGVPFDSFITGSLSTLKAGVVARYEMDGALEAFRDREF